MNAWLRAIEDAADEAEVVAQARDFCALLHPRDLAVLPEDMRRIQVERPSDIPKLRERLEECRAAARARAPDAQKLGDLVTYFARASAKLSEFGCAARL